MHTGGICGINGHAVARHGLILSEDGATAFRKPLGALLDPSDIVFAWILGKNVPKPGTTKKSSKMSSKMVKNVKNPRENFALVLLV